MSDCATTRFKRSVCVHRDACREGDGNDQAGERAQRHPSRVPHFAEQKAKERNPHTLSTYDFLPRRQSFEDFHFRCGLLPDFHVHLAFAFRVDDLHVRARADGTQRGRRNDDDVFLPRFMMIEIDNGVPRVTSFGSGLSKVTVRKSSGRFGFLRSAVAAIAVTVVRRDDRQLLDTFPVNSARIVNIHDDRHADRNAL